MRRFVIFTATDPSPLAEADRVVDVHMHVRALFNLGHGSSYRVGDRVTRHVHVYRVVRSRRRPGSGIRWRSRHVYTLAEPLP